MPVDMTKRIIVAAAAQLIATVRSPPESLQLDCTGTYTTAVLGVIEDANVGHIDGGRPPGKEHRVNLGESANMTYRVFTLRTLPLLVVDCALPPFSRDQTHLQSPRATASSHFKADPVGRFEAGPIAGFILHMADEAQTASPYIKPFVHDPKDDEAPFNAALKTKAKMWE